MFPKVIYFMGMKPSKAGRQAATNKEHWESTAPTWHYGYTLKEITDHLNLLYATISRAVTRMMGSNV